MAALIPALTEPLLLTWDDAVPVSDPSSQRAGGGGAHHEVGDGARQEVSRHHAGHYGEVTVPRVVVKEAVKFFNKTQCKNEQELFEAVSMMAGLVVAVLAVTATGGAATSGAAAAYTSL
jgi:hypothetical protein